MWDAGWALMQHRRTETSQNQKNWLRSTAPRTTCKWVDDPRGPHSPPQRVLLRRRVCQLRAQARLQRRLFGLKVCSHAGQPLLQGADLGLLVTNLTGLHGGMDALHGIDKQGESVDQAVGEAGRHTASIARAAPCLMVPISHPASRMHLQRAALCVLGFHLPRQRRVAQQSRALTLQRLHLALQLLRLLRLVAKQGTHGNATVSTDT